MLLCTHMVAHDGLADRFESALLQIGVVCRDKRSLVSGPAQHTAQSCSYERGTLQSINHFLIICPLSAPSFAAYDYIRSQLSARFGGSLDAALKSRKSWFHESSILSRFREDGEHKSSVITLADVIQGAHELEESFDGESTDDLALLIPKLEAELHPLHFTTNAVTSDGEDNRTAADCKQKAVTLAEKLIEPRVGTSQGQASSLPTLRSWLLSSLPPPSKEAHNISPTSAVTTTAATNPPRSPVSDQKRRRTHFGRLNAVRRRWETALPLLKLAREGKGKQIEKLCELLACPHERENSPSALPASALAKRSRPLTDLLSAAAHNPEARKAAAQALGLYNRRRAVRSSEDGAHPPTNSATSSSVPSKVELEEALDHLEEELAGSFGCENLKQAVWVAECEVRAEEWREAERRMRMVEEMSAQEQEGERQSSWRNATGWWWRRARL